MILRLMKEQEDGSYKVVGYEKDGYAPIVKTNLWLHSHDGDDWFIPTSFTRILHHRKDRDTGVDIDGKKVFERDYLETNDALYLVVWNYGAFKLFSIGMRWKLLSELKKFKITGIEGVNDER